MLCVLQYLIHNQDLIFCVKITKYIHPLSLKLNCKFALCQKIVLNFFLYNLKNPGKRLYSSECIFHFVTCANNFTLQIFDRTNLCIINKTKCMLFDIDFVRF